MMSISALCRRYGDCTRTMIVRVEDGVLLDMKGQRFILSKKNDRRSLRRLPVG